MVQSLFRNKGPLGAPKTMVQKSHLSGFNGLGKEECSRSIMDYLVANMISTRHTKYDSKAKKSS